MSIDAAKKKPGFIKKYILKPYIDHGDDIVAKIIEDMNADSDGRKMDAMPMPIGRDLYKREEMTRIMILKFISKHAGFNRGDLQKQMMRPPYRINWERIDIYDQLDELIGVGYIRCGKYSNKIYITSEGITFLKYFYREQDKR